MTSVADTWCEFGLAEINQMIRNLDHKNSGHVSWRVLMTHIILLRSEVPTAKEISRIEKMLKDAEVTEEQFCALTFWFDESETS